MARSPSPYPCTRRPLWAVIFVFSQFADGIYKYIILFVVCFCWFACFFFLSTFLKVLFCCVLVTCKDTTFKRWQNLQILPIFFEEHMFHEMLNYRLSIKIHIFQYFFSF